MIENYVIALESLYILDEPAELLASADELLEQASALESFADEMDFDLAIECAMEASGEEVDTSASEISAKYRSGFNKIKKGKRTKNQKLVSEGQREVKEASNELKEAEKNADTPEKKKKLSAVAKIAIAVGGATLLSLLIYVGVKNRRKIVDIIKKLKKNPGTNVIQTVAEVTSAAQTAASVPVEEKPVEVSDDESMKPIIDSFKKTMEDNMKDLDSKMSELNNTKQQSMSNIKSRHEELNKALASVKSISSEPGPDDNSKAFDKIDSKLDKLLIETPSQKVPTERQKKAEQIRTERARKKELKDWKIARKFNPRSFTSSKLTKEEYDKMTKAERDKVKHTGRLDYEYHYGKKDQYNTDRKKAGWYGADSTFKYDSILRNMYKYGPRSTLTDKDAEKVEKRDKLLIEWLKKDISKLSNLTEDKVSNMSEDDLAETNALLRKVTELCDQFTKDKGFTPVDMTWYDKIEPKLDKIIRMVNKEYYKRT